MNSGTLPKCLDFLVGCCLAPNKSSAKLGLSGGRLNHGKSETDGILLGISPVDFCF
jgi:hypothetical protein